MHQCIVQVDLPPFGWKAEGFGIPPQLIDCVASVVLIRDLVPINGR